MYNAQCRYSSLLLSGAKAGLRAVRRSARRTPGSSLCVRRTGVDSSQRVQIGAQARRRRAIHRGTSACLSTICCTAAAVPPRPRSESHLFDEVLSQRRRSPRRSRRCTSIELSSLLGGDRLAFVVCVEHSQHRGLLATSVPRVLGGRPPIAALYKPRRSAAEIRATFCQRVDHLADIGDIVVDRSDVRRRAAFAVAAPVITSITRKVLQSRDDEPPRLPFAP